jgi:hypothetical protein
MEDCPKDGLINVWDLDSIRLRRPFLVAHRGGVILPGTPENSLAAVRLAVRHGYDMVELDVREAKDGEPILFHGSAGRGLMVDCGVEAFVEDLSSEELRSLCYRASTEHIATLAEALALCASLKLGVMLDIKTGEWSEAYVQRITDLIKAHGLSAATVTITRHPIAWEYLADRVIFPVSREDARRVLAGEAVPLQGQFWFGWAAELPDAAVPLLQRSGAFVVPSINTFHYPAHARVELARQDIERLYAAGVEGFQIDSAYRPFVPID